MPLHSAVFRFRTPHARAILSALEPELADEVNPRSATKAFCEDDGTLVLAVESADTPALRAALNMALRLVSVAEEMQEIAKGTSRDPGNRSLLHFLKYPGRE